MRLTDRLWAAGMFFTRLPLWRIKQVPAEAFKQIVPCWSLMGWFTGGVMAGTYWLVVPYVQPEMAVILALLARLALTGALHEDGLADFFDGFGGGRNRESVLRIMKDSHIGTYGVLALLFYFLLSYQTLSHLPTWQMPWVLWAADAWSKMVAAQLINVLPYARPEADSKAQVVYSRMRGSEWLLSAVGGVVLVGCCPFSLYAGMLASVVVWALLVGWMKHRLQGYTGDCCGATFLLCELSFWLATAYVSSLF